MSFDIVDSGITFIDGGEKYFYVFKGLTDFILTRGFILFKRGMLF